MYHIPVLDNLLKKSLKEYPYYLYNKKQVYALYEAIVLLNMKFCSAKEFRSMIDFLPKSDIQNLANTIHTSSILMLNLRGFLFEIIQKGLSSTEEVLNCLKKFGLYKEELHNSSIQNLQIILFLNEAHSLDEYISQIKNLPPALPPIEVKKLCEENIKKLSPFLKNYTYRKLRFLANNNVSSMEDLYSTLVCAVCTNCYDLQGKFRGLRLLNSLRRGAINAGLNIIYFYTSKSRQRVIEEDDGFINRIVSTNVTNDSGKEEDLFNFLPFEDTSKQAIELKTNIYYEKKRLLNICDKDSALIKLLDIMDNNNSEFVSWYNKKYRKNIKEVVSVQEETGDKFLDNIQSYLDISKKSLDFLISEIKFRFNLAA